MLLMVMIMRMMMLSVGLILIGLLYKAHPNCWHHRCTILLRLSEGALALVMLSVRMLLTSICVDMVW